MVKSIMKGLSRFSFCTLLAMQGNYAGPGLGGGRELGAGLGLGGGQ